MRKQVIKVLVVFVLMICFCAHISEQFDTWDHTLQTGNDIESTLVVVALCLGVCVVLVSMLLRFFRSLILGSNPSLIFQPLSSSTHVAVPILLSGSPPPLRV